MIPFVRDMAFAYGESREVSPLIRRVVAENPSPFTYFGTGTYIVGRGEVAVIDPGPDLPAHLEALLAAIPGERVSAILTTHTHLDHSPLAHPLAQRTGAKIWGRREPGRPSGFAEADQPHFRPDVEIADGEIVSGPGWTLKALATPGHASNHVAFALAEENALFCGDHVMGWSTTVISPPDGDMGDYYASLAKVRSGDFATLWPTHGPPVVDVAPFLDAYLEHRLDRERQILQQLASGHGRIEEMTAAMYGGLDRRLHAAAAQSVLAHLIHLVRGGRAACADPVPALDSLFHAVA